jgi:hypothetical protein
MGRLRTGLVAVATVVATVAVAQFFGYVGPHLSTVKDVAPMMGYRDSAKVLTGGTSGEAMRLLSAANLGASRPFGTTVYLATVPGDPVPALADQWLLALSQQWSVKSGQPPNELARWGPQFETFSKAADATRTILRQDPALSVVVAPEALASIRRQLPDDLQARIISW